MSLGGKPKVLIYYQLLNGGSPRLPEVCKYLEDYLCDKNLNVNITL
jgi:hypothetical protein